MSDHAADLESLRVRLVLAQGAIMGNSREPNAALHRMQESAPRVHVTCRIALRLLADAEAEVEMAQHALPREEAPIYIAAGWVAPEPTGHGAT